MMALSFLMYACAGQVEPTTTSSSRSQLILQAPHPSEFKDPLFFIEGQLCQHLREIFEDSQGNLWFGTNVYDLMRYNGDTLVYITEDEGFSGGRVTGIVEDHNGNLWFSTGSGLNKYDGESFRIFTEEDGLANQEIWSMHLDTKGMLWMGHNKGLSRFDGKVFEEITVPKAQVKEPDVIYSEDRITAIVEDEKGHLWLGTDGYGICRYDGESFSNFTVADGMADNTIYDLMYDSQGNLWIGTFWGGVSKYDGEKFINYTKDGIVSGEEAGAFFEEDNGDVWFGVENNGVYKYDGDNFTHYPPESLSNGTILRIFKDQQERFWFGGWGGLFRYNEGFFTPVTKEGPWK